MTDLENVLNLVEQLHSCTSSEQLIHTAIYGVGALIPSVSCAWTEFSVESFLQGPLEIGGGITDESLKYDVEEPVIAKYAYQHPCIAEMIKTGTKSVLAISDRVTAAEYHRLELYQLFYRRYATEDQLTAAYVRENSIMVGLSVNRDTWGFTDEERKVLNTVSHCIFSLYELLERATKGVTTTGASRMEVNINSIVEKGGAVGNHST